MASKTTTLLPTLLDFAFVFKFNERVFNLEKDLSEIKQVDQYAQALSRYSAIVDPVSDFSNPMIEKNVTKLVEVAVLTRSLSQPTSTYEAAASLSEIHDEAMIETSAGSRQWEGKKVSSKEYETSNDYRSKEKKSLWRKT
ncbi:hypothetical protein Tco_1264239 [Tanacetum coccineum]